jgi:uncharacterized protein (UPF0212 family)
MRESHSLPYDVNVEIQPPACPMCRTHMMLARITPPRVDYDMRTFECPQCEYVHEVMVANDAFAYQIDHSVRKPVSSS